MASPSSQPRSGVHLVVDAVGVRPDSGGVVVLADLLREAAAHPGVRRTTVFVSCAADLRLPARAETKIIADVGSSRARLLWWNGLGLERRAASLGADAILSLNGLGQARRLPIFLLFQQQLMFAPPARREMGLSFRLRLALLTRLAVRACHGARTVFVQAEHVRDNLLSHFSLPPEKICVVPPDVSWPTAGERGPTREAGLIAYVGSNRQHKSLATLLRAFELARAQLPGLRLELTLPSSLLPARAGVTALGRLDRGGVQRLLQRAQLLVMPSLAETVGLPLLEAMDLGCAVVAADLPYAREVCGDSALYFCPTDERACAAQMLALLRSGSLRDVLGERARARLERRRASEPYKELLNQLLLRLS